MEILISVHVMTASVVRRNRTAKNATCSPCEQVACVLII